jgi:hypothetical protein
MQIMNLLTKQKMNISIQLKAFNTNIYIDALLAVTCQATFKHEVPPTIYGISFRSLTFIGYLKGLLIHAFFDKNWCIASNACKLIIIIIG